MGYGTSPLQTVQQAGCRPWLVSASAFEKAAETAAQVQTGLCVLANKHKHNHTICVPQRQRLVFRTGLQAYLPYGAIFAEDVIHLF